MTKLNPVKVASDIVAANDAHKNFMGENSWELNPLLRLRVMAASSFFGEPMYYMDKDAKSKKAKGSRSASSASLSKAELDSLNTHLNSLDDYSWRGLTPQASMERAIDEALAYDAEGTLRFAVELRRDLNIRTTPQVIMVRAANNKALKGTGLVRSYNREVMRRMDEPSTQMAYQLSAFGKPIPNALKRSWKDRLETANDYQLAKYRQDGSVVKTVDVVNIACPRATSSVDKLVRGELRLSSGDDEEGVKTWESIRSAGGSWESAVDVMGHMALLRNLRNFIENKVDPSLWMEKFVSGAPTGKQLPFRYFSAYQQIKATATGPMLDAVEAALNASLTNLPRLTGKSLVLTDNSGSAQGTTTSSMGTVQVNHIGNLMGILTGMVSDEGRLGVFGDRISYQPIRKTASVFDQLNDANALGSKVGASTEHGIWLAFDDLIRNREHVDNIFVYSDMQAGHGGLYGTGGYDEFVWGRSGSHRHIDVAALIRRYRQVVNPKVNVFLVQVAGYGDALVPENYYRTAILGGWSDQVLKYASEMATIWDEMDTKKA